MSHAHYLHPEQRDRIRRLHRRWHWRLELPTWGIMAAVYGGWFGVAHYWQALGPWLGAPLLILLTTGYMSLQHELIHGHPTRWPRVNQLFGLLPLAVWYPYGLYRDSHLRHHRNDHLTDPHEDPESYYFSAAQWRRYPRLLPLLAAVRNTLIGRVLLGPALDIVTTLFGAVKTLLAG
ncbi:fatty acid desaturase, partial [Serratia nematodiphila DZ0503SBS1]